MPTSHLDFSSINAIISNIMITQHLNTHTLEVIYMIKDTPVKHLEEAQHIVFEELVKNGNSLTADHLTIEVCEDLYALFLLSNNNNFYALFICLMRLNTMNKNSLNRENIVEKIDTALDIFIRTFPRTQYTPLWVKLNIKAPFFFDNT